MKSEDFIRNLRGIDNNRDLDEEMLTGIYERIRNQEFRPGNLVYLQNPRVISGINLECDAKCLLKNSLVKYRKGLCTLCNVSSAFIHILAKCWCVLRVYVQRYTS